MHLIELADNSARCDYDEHTLAHLLGVTTRTARKGVTPRNGKNCTLRLGSF